MAASSLKNSLNMPISCAYLSASGHDPQSTIRVPNRHFRPYCRGGCWCVKCPCCQCITWGVVHDDPQMGDFRQVRAQKKVGSSLSDVLPFPSQPLFQMCCGVRNGCAPVVRLASGETEEIVGVVPLIVESSGHLSAG